MATALITGITGFAGRYLAAHLGAQDIRCVGMARGGSPIAHPISLDGIPVHDVDIRNRTAVREVLRVEQPDFVFHLAAVTHVPSTRANPELTFEVNVGGTFNLLESIRQLALPARVVLVSSGNLYGNIDSGEGGFTETDAVRATSPYASAKLMSEQLAHSYADDFGLPIVIARPFNHTGPGQPPSFVCAEFARAIGAAIVRGGPVHIRTGSLEPRRDFSDVRDIVRAYTMLAQNGNPGETYNVCSGSTVAIGEIVRILGEAGMVQVTTEIDSSRLRQREILRSGGNCTKIRHELGWIPEIPITKTLQDLLGFWVEQARSARSD